MMEKRKYQPSGIFRKISTWLFLATICIFVIGCQSDKMNEADFSTALENGQLANESYDRCLRLTRAWVARKDTASGLIPSNFGSRQDLYEPHNAGADNYSFMVLTSYLLDQDLLNGEMLNMLSQEKKLTSRVNSLPDTYSFSKKGFNVSPPDRNWIIFSTSEYIKDGLIPITEYMGPSPWSERMMEMIGDLPQIYDVLKNLDQLGTYKVASEEVNGEMLQTLSRLYWMTGDEKILDWAVRIGDYYLKGDRDLTKVSYLRLRDHGCEVIGGLSELYTTLHFARPAKKAQYEENFHRLLDRVLEVGRNADSLFYNAINPSTGDVADEGVADTFGYIYDAYYSVYLVDGNEKYRQAVLNGLRSLNDKYRNFAWEGTSHDGYADAIEGAINMYNRERDATLKEWIDSEIKVMWGMQQEDGIVGGGWPDGNFSRTNIMYSLWKTQGTHIFPWRKEVVIGADRSGDTLKIALSAGQEWNGKLTFDYKRHKEILHLPIDYPRLNQFPEWFTVDKDTKYNFQIINKGVEEVYTGDQLIKGVPVNMEAGDVYHIIVWAESE